MSSIFGIYNAQRAMLVNQSALNVVSNNISNMNTEGYSKQRVELSQVTLQNPNPSLMGGGVEIDAITRNRDIYLDKYYRSENTDLAFSKELNSISQLIEDTTNELGDSGISKALSNFYDASQQLSGNPTDLVMRTNFVEKAVDLSIKLNQTSTRLSDLRESLVGDSSNLSSIDTSKVNIECEELNANLLAVAKLNQNIATLSTQGTTPNGLLDERDRLLDKISEYIPVTVKEGPNNSIGLTLGGVELVNGFEQVGFFKAINNPSLVPSETSDCPAIVKITDKSGVDTVADIKTISSTGKIAATLEMGSSDLNKLTINNLIKDLDKLALGFASEVNAVQLYNNGPDPADPLDPPTESSMCIDNSKDPKELKLATQAIFLDSTDTTTNITAANIKINQAIIDNPYEIATAKTGIDNTSGVSLPQDVNATGNNDNILSIAQIRNKNIVEGSTAEGFLASMIGNMGLKTESIKNTYERQGAVVDQIKSRRDNSTGVNLDEELIDLVKYQRAYEASTRIFNVNSEIMQKIVNLGL